MTLSAENKDYKVICAAFPHVGKRLAVFWGEPEFTALVDDLQHNRRGENRTGFPADVLFAIESLVSEHDRVYPKLARREVDLWNLSKAR